MTTNQGFLTSIVVVLVSVIVICIIINVFAPTVACAASLGADEEACKTSIVTFTAHAAEGKEGAQAPTPAAKP